MIRGLVGRYRDSLHLKLFLPTLVAGLALAIAGGFGFFALFKDHGREETSRWAERLARTVALAGRSAPGTRGLQRFVDALGEEPEVREIVVVTGKPPRVVAATRKGLRRSPLGEIPDPEARGSIEGALRGTPHLRWIEGDRFLNAALPLHAAGGQGGAGREKPGAVFVVLDTGTELAAHRAHALLSALALGGAILLFAALGYALLRVRVMRPIRAIHRTLEYRRSGHLQSYAPVESGDELGALARTVNSLLDAQEERTALYRQMFRDHPAVKLLVDPEGAGTVVDANDAAIRFYGYTSEQLKGMALARINNLT
ncbi:MAG TPA: HAMP domain-containing protein, partial [Gammaproteobacteria bacterium]|nr:HAMP domain-containing protein [Gammaproteobacteria bacterium]